MNKLPSPPIVFFSWWFWCSVLVAYEWNGLLAETLGNLSASSSMAGRIKSYSLILIVYCCVCLRAYFFLSVTTFISPNLSGGFLSVLCKSLIPKFPLTEKESDSVLSPGRSCLATQVPRLQEANQDPPESNFIIINLFFFLPLLWKP